MKLPENAQMISKATEKMLGFDAEAIVGGVEWDAVKLVEVTPQLYIAVEDIKAHLPMRDYARVEIKGTLCRLKKQKPADKCTCHERDSSYVCEYCYAQGERGHMQQ